MAGDSSSPPPPCEHLVTPPPESPETEDAETPAETSATAESVSAEAPADTAGGAEDSSTGAEDAGAEDAGAEDAGADPGDTATWEPGESPAGDVSFPDEDNLAPSRASDSHVDFEEFDDLGSAGPAADAAPEDAASEDAGAGDAAPEDAASGDAAPGDAASGDAASGDAAPDTAASEDAAPVAEETGAEEGASEEESFGGAPSFEDTLPAADPDFDEDFDALGFDTGFGLGTFGSAPGSGLGDNDDTPPGGIYVGEEVAVLDASSIGRALAEASGKQTDFSVPDLAGYQGGLVGIDIGAAKAVVSCFNADGHHEIVPNEDDDLSTPVSIFLDDDGERLVGREARLMAASAPDQAVVNLKEAMTEPGFALETEGETLVALDVVQILIQRLLQDVQEHLGTTPTHVALAAPAWFGEEQHKLLSEAIEKLDVELVGITEEALASTVPYSLRLPDLKPRVALIFDHGHAALGVAAVRCAAGDIEVLAHEARRELGSSSWDELLANEAARKFEEKHGFDPRKEPGAAIDLKIRAEDAKRALSQRAQCTLVVSSEGKTIKVGFTRSGLEKAGKSLIEGARKLTRSVRKGAGLKGWDDFDALILGGGGSRTPSLRRMLSKETGLKPERGISPEESVAVGALYWGLATRCQQDKS